MQSVASPMAAERIAARIPNAKILVMLLDPAERAYTQNHHGVGDGAIRWSFREHIERSLRNRSGQFCVTRSNSAAICIDSARTSG